MFYLLSYRYFLYELLPAKAVVEEPTISWPIELLLNDGCIFNKHHQTDNWEAHFEFCGWYLDLPLGVVPLEEQDIFSKENLKVGTWKTFVPLLEEDQVRLDTAASQASKLNAVLESPLAGVKKRSGPQGKKTSDKSNDNIKKKKKSFQI